MAFQSPQFKRAFHFSTALISLRTWPATSIAARWSSMWKIRRVPDDSSPFPQIPGVGRKLPTRAHQNDEDRRNRETMRPVHASHGRPVAGFIGTVTVLIDS